MGAPRDTLTPNPTSSQPESSWPVLFGALLVLLYALFGLLADLSPYPWMFEVHQTLFHQRLALCVVALGIATLRLAYIRRSAERAPVGARSIPQLTLATSLRSLAARCAWCHDDALDPVPYPCCGTVLHAECADEAGRCPTLGCTALS